MAEDENVSEMSVRSLIPEKAKFGCRMFVFLQCNNLYNVLGSSENMVFRYLPGYKSAEAYVP
jgi:hypothetical protein